MDKIELELTVTGRSNKELERMAEWCYHCGLIELEEEEGDHPSTDGDCKNKISDMVFISLRISQYAFEGKGDSAGADTSLEEGGLKLGQELWRTLMNDRLLDDGEDAEKLRADGDAQKETVAEHFGDILFNLFGPIWECIMNPQQHKPLAALLSRLVAFSISFDRSPEIQEMPVPSEFMTESEAKSKTQQGDGDGKRVYSPTHVNQYKVKGSFAPPDAFFAYHIWRNIHTINCFTSAHHFFWSGLRKNNNSNTSENGTKVNWGYDTLFSTQRSSSAREAKKSNVNETFDYEETQSEYTVDGGANRNNNNNNVNRKFMEAPAAFGSPFWSYFIPEHSVFRYYEPLFKNNSTLKFRIHGSNNSMLDNTSSGMVGNKDKTLFMEAVLGLLLADEIVNPYVAFEWSPMSYYYYLTQRCIMLSPSRNKKAPTLVRNTLLNKAIPMSVHLGLNSMIVTLEPLFYVSSNDALNEELEDLKKNYYLSTTDVNEMCLHGVEQRGRGTFYRSSLRPGAGPYLDEWYSWGIRCWPRTPYQMNHAQYTQVPSLRLYYRETALLHEVELLARWGIFGGRRPRTGQRLTRLYSSATPP
ncbi:hypothetical protein AGDE_15113 [Angomonas deanei]|nr:hypothetical protein AGDE_15113 [Angomonas deanei]|eukprot:EPY19671.1 hypothetical protein AGDE_15113 [Angomonas deanei]